MPEPQLLQNVLDKLQQVKRSGNGYSALCPAHPDTEASMSVKLGDTGAIILNCHRGCNKQDIVEQLGLTMSQLWPDTTDKPKKRNTKKKYVEHYSYYDDNGTELFQVVKFVDEDGKKSFGQRVDLGNNQYNWTTAGIPKPIYRLPQIREAIKNGEPIYIAEGEKDVHSLEKLGLHATTNPGGANAWMDRHTNQLEGATNIYIVADNDTPGLNHAEHIHNELNKRNITNEILTPPPQHNDVTDMLNNGQPLSNLQTHTPNTDDEYTQLLTQLTDIQTQDWTYDTKLTHAQKLIQQQTTETIDTGRLIDWQTFLKEPVDPYNWVIPNLIEHEDRTIVVAAEGVGKTMLARQIALCVANGTHPFTRARIPQKRTLFIDLENPQRIIRRTSTKIMDALQNLHPNYNIPAHLYTKPDGLNILKTHDQQLIEKLIQQTEPDLICLGPLYKTFIDPGGRTPESVTTEVAMYLDYIRTTYKVALWLEHHAPLGGTDTTRQLRPFGSSVWSRWPEFGIALQPDPTIPHQYHLNHFRGARDERDWPQSLQRDTILPFSANWA